MRKNYTVPFFCYGVNTCKKLYVERHSEEQIRWVFGDNLEIVFHTSP